mmetsp:Transcript_10839/g.25971  ORF Transcript_10839/g.25971 Transcript_10839/m.25971 type:complete len:274 (+) Transcript_10839:964-1785(+)
MLGLDLHILLQPHPLRHHASRRRIRQPHLASATHAPDLDALQVCGLLPEVPPVHAHPPPAVPRAVRACLRVRLPVLFAPHNLHCRVSLNRNLPLNLLNSTDKAVRVLFLLLSFALGFVLLSVIPYALFLIPLLVVLIFLFGRRARYRLCCLLLPLHLLVRSARNLVDICRGPGDSRVLLQSFFPEAFQLTHALCVGPWRDRVFLVHVICPSSQLPLAKRSAVSWSTRRWSAILVREKLLCVNLFLRHWAIMPLRQLVDILEPFAVRSVRLPPL